MPAWAKWLLGIVVAIPVGFFAFGWWLETTFTSGGCRSTGFAESTLVGATTYQVLRLRCSGREDEFTVAVGPAGDRQAAISALGGAMPALARMDGNRVAVFTAGATEIRVELDDRGYPKARVDMKDGKVLETVPHRRPER